MLSYVMSSDFIDHQTPENLFNAVLFTPPPKKKVKTFPGVTLKLNEEVQWMQTHNVKLIWQKIYWLNYTHLLQTDFFHHLPVFGVYYFVVTAACFCRWLRWFNGYQWWPNLALNTTARSLHVVDITCRFIGTDRLVLECVMWRWFWLAGWTLTHSV